MISIPPAPNQFMPSSLLTDRRIELIPSDRIGDALELWRHVDEANPTQHVTASWPWVHAWVGAFADTARITAVLWYDGDSIVGCGLIVMSSHRTMGRVPLHTVHIGTTGEIEPGGAWAEYVRPWVYREHEAAAFTQILIAIAAQRPCHRIDLDGMDEALFRSLDFTADELDRKTSYQFEFSGVSPTGRESAESMQQFVLSQLGKSTRKNVKRRLNQYAGLRTEWADDADDSFLDELINLHQARWSEVGKPGSFAEPQFRKFVRSFTQLAANRGGYFLSKVMDDDGTVGCQLLLREENRLQDYVAGFASTVSRQSPGLICHFANIVEAGRRGFDGYEFLVGDARLKRDLSNTSRDVVWAKQLRPTRRTRVLAAARKAFRAVKKLRSISAKRISIQQRAVTRSGAAYE